MSTIAGTDDGGLLMGCGCGGKKKPAVPVKPAAAQASKKGPAVWTGKP